jgi:hypothetical protein
MHAGCATTCGVLQARAGSTGHHQQLQSDVKECVPPAVLCPQDAPRPVVYCKPGLGVWGITKAVMRDHWPYALGVVMSYLVSFMLFPAVLGYVEVRGVVLVVAMQLTYLEVL